MTNNRMKLFLISQEENSDYDTFDAFVVAAVSARDAKGIKTLSTPKDTWEAPNDWCRSKKSIKVKFLGLADKSITRGVILGSFNAG